MAKKYQRLILHIEITSFPPASPIAQCIYVTSQPILAIVYEKRASSIHHPSQGEAELPLSMPGCDDDVFWFCWLFWTNQIRELCFDSMCGQRAQICVSGCLSHIDNAQPDAQMSIQNGPDADDRWRISANVHVYWSHSQLVFIFIFLNLL